MDHDNCWNLDASTEPRSSTLGIVSVSIAFIVTFLLGVAYAMAMNPRGSILYTVVGHGAYTALAYLCAAACLLGLAFGIEGCHRPTSLKVPATVGASLNATLLLSMAFGPFVARLMIGPME